MRWVHCICLLAALVVAPAEAGQAAQTAGTTAYAVFLKGAPLGREEVSIQTDAAGTTVSSRLRLAPPLNLSLDRVEIKYGADWSPLSFSAQGTIGGGELALRTGFAGGNAVTEGTQSGKPVSVSHPVSPQAVILPNSIYAAYAALARRLQGAAEGTAFRAYVLPVTEIGARVASIRQGRIQVGDAILPVRRYELVFANPGGDLAVNLTTTEEGVLLRIDVPAAGLDVVREDLASSTSRTQVFTNAGDEPATIPRPGFNLAATVTRPASGARRAPAVVLVSDSTASDRDGFGFGVPIYGQLAGALADAGFLVVRYDRRGFGQSGGRAESATISDDAEDARGVVRWVSERDDVDPGRIALVGHGHGGWAALLAASRDRRRVAAVAVLAAPGSRGDVLLIEQQQLALERLNLTPAEREARIEMQKRIHAAVLSGKGWESIPAEMRREADTPWLHSLLRFEPEKAVEDVDQPLLIVHGELDREVPAAHADRLAAIARRESDSPSIEVVIVRGVNHLLVPADTGEVAEYASLRDRSISPEATKAVSGWLARVLARPR